MSLLSRLAVQAARAYGILSSNPNNVSASYLVVAGGGAGAIGGAGAGGLLASTATLSTLTTYSITVGAGGAAAAAAGSLSTGASGSNSILSGTGLTTITSTGGGGGGGSNLDGGAGGSGGGAGATAVASHTGGAGTSGQGNNGGAATSGAVDYVSGGGGGAGAVGGASSGNTSGSGGNGSASSISGSSVTYAGGGGGGSRTPQGTSSGSAGTGGGGAGSGTTNGSNGTANLGGGGGGGCISFGGNPTTSTGGSGGSGIVIISYTSATPKFVGGTLTTINSGATQVHTFTSSGTLSPLTPVTASYLVVAGGGGTSLDRNGGGGGGGLLSGSTTLYSGATYVVTVGAGGAGGSGASNATSAQDGSNSILSGTGLTTLTATGGGGGNGAGGAGRNGGSGGGGGGNGSTSTSGGTGTSGQGTNGGNGFSVGGGGLGGGGGGATSAGANATSTVGGAGGAGTASSITGSSVTYAGGGGGGGSGTNTAGTGGAGGGGNGAAGSPATQLAGVSGTANLGGGGGGGTNYSSSSVTQASGGSGTVIISYAGSQVFNGGLVTSSGGNTIHTFNATGALTPLTNNLNNSLRFRASASAYLSRTPTIAGSRTTWTWSAWVKKAVIGTANQKELFGVYSSGTNYSHLYFDTNDTLIFADYISSSLVSAKITTAVYRDPSAWYHVVIVYDTTQATANDRIRLYVNGNQITSFSTNTNPSQNYASGFINSANATTIGVQNSAYYFDGNMADINFIDGQALEPYYFGNNDAYGNWKPIKYTGMYGTNGFYLTFGNTTSTTTLGYDSSPNGNNWTCNNISLTAGTTYDAMLDVPTNTSATVANYCVLNPLANAGTLSGANLNLTTTSSGQSNTFGTIYVSSGKWYWEITSTADAAVGTMIGIADSSIAFASGGYYQSALGYGYYSQGGTKHTNSTSVVYGSSYTTNDVIGVALDMDAGTLTFYKNNTSQGTAFSSLTGLFAPAVCDGGTGSVSVAANFGQRPFTYTPPTGYVALNTYNLPTPTILQGNKYMDATLYTGNAVGLTAVNQGQFKPDLVWIKDRSQVAQHVLTDSVRGTSAQLFSSLTNAEQTNSTYVTSFNTNGFTVGVGNAGTGVVNNSGDNLVGWQWQAGQGSTSSNTSGTITSTVSVNTTAGFSIVTYTGNNTNGATVGHGLGVAPKMIITKVRSTTGDWWTWQTAMGDNVVKLNTTAAQVASTGNSVYNTASFSSTVFALGAGVINGSGATHVSYCWAEIAGFSKFGSYTGNGSTDGVFVYLGFRPKYVMIKCSSAAANDWPIIDTSRATYNAAGPELYADLSQAESTSNYIDIVSNGFKIRSTGGQVNTSATTYIYAAWAENPFKNSNAR